MGFCSEKQYEHFLKQVPQIERIIAHEGIFFFKFYLDIGREMQLKRFHDRRFDQRAIWKLSDMDIAALGKWDDYTDKRDRMLKETHTDNAPWTVVRASDKHRARLNLIRHMLTALDYQGKDAKRSAKSTGRSSGPREAFRKSGPSCGDRRRCYCPGRIRTA